MVLYTHMAQMVTVALGAADNVIVDSPVNDYRFRGLELENFNVLDFFWDTYEKSEKQLRNLALEDEAHVDGGEDNGTEPSMNKSQYLPLHPKHGKSVRFIRSPNHNAIPNFTGRFLPRNDDQDIHDLYCASVLALAKPWQELPDLKDEWKSWDEEFEDFLRTCPKRLRDIIGNLQHFYRCGDAASKESHLSSATDIPNEVGADSEELQEASIIQNEANVGSPNPEIDMGEQIHQAIMYQISPAEFLHGALAIDIGRSVGLFDRFHSVWKPTASPVTVEELERLQRWKAKMTKEANNSRVINQPMAEEDDSMEIGDTDVQMASDTVEPSVLVNSNIAEEILSGLDPSNLLRDQR